jgi:hypothetical protein
MIARFARLVVIVMLVVTTGMHWALLQSVAWTTMLMDNLNRGSVVEAVAHTFDGKHPCRLCKAIDTGKKTEKNSQCVIELKKFEMLNPATTLAFVASSGPFILLPRWQHTYSSFRFPPPVPPPRAA